MQTYLTLRELRAKLGNRSRSAIYLDLGAGLLPQPIKLGGGQMETPRGWQADTGQDGRYATAADTCTITRGAARRKGCGVRA